MRKIVGFLMVALLGGCGDDKNGSDTEGTGGSTSGVTTGAATEASGATGGATDGGATDGGSGGVTDGGSGGATDGGATADPTGGGGGGGSVEEGCAAICDKLGECMLDMDAAACAAACVDELGGGTGECLTAIEEYLACVETMSCGQLEGLFVGGDPGKCTEAVNQAEMLCEGGGGECVVEIGGNANACSLTETCPGEPTFELQCDKNECVCLVDGMEAGDPCPSDGVCMTQDQLEAKVAECCPL